MTPVLIIMVKEPRPGRVKTRLGRDIGSIAATWWFRHQSARLIRRLRDPRWRIVLAVAPDMAVASRVWPADILRHPQGQGDLGQRMKSMLRRAGAMPGQINQGPTCLIGADIPGINRAHIARAFAALGNHDAVFGPAPDGGYWLVGVKHPKRLPRSLFKDVRWSSEHALADTLRGLPGYRIALTDQLRDVDTGADLKQS
ncbi:TIGR04282 family arsenosugar biosynthesis glycosyltransferase [Phaeobacter sp. 11ANDIMAR09]|uniref:TIGR04282 family arsenosugar biosynthesis glycosyltransferase n=1 Tax=Phaeobacter sp. 11ANDIMAR09 TaxID=1225647 RepID=UPI000B2478E3|nr:TIGR04282 family arsenosugar biosynthesis glycosyltransferase [Phaeobacter sp. 11ANDIMAR09]